MKILNANRTLGYKKAREINLDELEQIGGGSSSGANTSRFTTKQTLNSGGGWDVGVDYQWD